MENNFSINLKYLLCNWHNVVSSIIQISKYLTLFKLIENIVTLTIHSKHNLPCKFFAVTYQEKKCYKTLGYAQMVTPWSLFSNLTTSQSLWAGYEAVTKGLGGNMWGGFENGVHSGSQNGGLLIVRYALYSPKPQS